MTARSRTSWTLSLALMALCAPTAAQGVEAQEAQNQAFDWDAIKQQGAQRSSYRSAARPTKADAPTGPDFAAFRASVRPVLERGCFRCHGEKRQKGDLRLDTLDPDLFGGDDVDWLTKNNVL